VPDPIEPLVRIPVSAEDIARKKRRRIVTGVTLLVIAAAVAFWLYRRSADPVQAQASFSEAQRAFAVARYDQAIVDCDRAIGLKRDFADAYLLRGRAYILKYDADKGIADFTRAIKFRPDDPQALLERANAYINQTKDYAAAVADATAAASIDPKLARAYNLRGTALRAMGEPQKAMAEFSRAVELEPNADNYYQRGATYQIVGDHKRAILDFTQVIALGPNKPQPYYARAESELFIGEKEQANKDRAAARSLDSH
jgi:tetratricopeptide (TPR) repeat protein